MSYRLHTATKHHIEYGNGALSGNMQDEFAALIREEMDVYMDNDYQDEIEIDRDIFKDYLNKLGRRVADEPSLYLSEHTNHDEYELLAGFYKEADPTNNYIHLTWF